MVARITIPVSVIETLNYNEKKVQKGTAECIGAGNFLTDPEKINFYQKLAAFENRNIRNERAITKTLHVSLNFDPSEKLSKQQLNEIADNYMEKIGFSKQPYLVYQHQDAGHPHIHIVTTTIKEDGRRISTHNIGRIQSEKARKEIEQAFNLVKAENQKREREIEIRPIDVTKALYGKSETKKSITNVLNAVVNKYNYTSLPELNAVLRQFNVTADRGSVDGIMFQKRGLLYRILDRDGNTIGVPIKASSINGKPTLNAIEKRFALNEANREPLKLKIKNTIDEVLLENPASLKYLLSRLERKQIYTVIRQNAEGRMYGITFVDNRSKSVFNGSEIGKGYSIGALQSKVINTVHSPSQKEQSKGKHKDLLLSRTPKNESLFEQLMAPHGQFENVPFQLLKKKKKKRKKNLGL